MCGLCGNFNALFLVLGCFLQRVYCAVVLEEKLVVISEQFIYRTVHSNETLYFQLDSPLGDCDLYLSENSPKPTCDIYSYHSITWGRDSIIIPKRGSQGIHIGVYGSPYFEKSHCELLVCSLNNLELPDEYTDQLSFLSSIEQDEIDWSCNKYVSWRSRWKHATGGTVIGSLFWVTNSIWNATLWLLSNFISFVRAVDSEWVVDVLLS